MPYIFDSYRHVILPVMELNYYPASSRIALSFIPPKLLSSNQMYTIVRLTSISILVTVQAPYQS